MTFFRQRMQQTPGFAGGALEEQLLRSLKTRGDVNAGGDGQELGQEPQILTPQNQAAITRPRQVMPSHMRDMLARQAQQPLTTSAEINETPLAMRPMQQEMNPLPDTSPFGSSGEPFNATRPRRTQMRDFIADDTAYLRELEAQPRNWKDKTVDAFRALNQNINGTSGTMPTKRERDIARAQGMLQRDMAVDKQQTDAALKSLVPVQLNDGRIVYTPARSAGSLSSQQQRIGEQAMTGAAHRARWRQMGKHEAIQDALRVYNSGGANDPDTLAAISDTLGLPANLKPKFVAGEILVQPDETGTVQLINKRDGSVVNTGVVSYETTKEKGRNDRQERSARAAMQRTEALIRAGINKLGDPNVTEATAAELEDQAQEADDLAESLTNQGLPSQGAKAAERAVRLRQTITNLKEAANKARTAQGATGTKAGKIQPGENPDIRAYANQFFNGNYQKAFEAVQAQKQNK